MTFENALRQVALGKRVTRSGWKNVTMYLRVWEALPENVLVQEGDSAEEVQMTQVIGFPYSTDGNGMPVSMVPGDIEATDWVVIE
jgi:hypothetical protein